MESHPDNVPPPDVLPALDGPMKEKIDYFDLHPEDIRPEDLNNLAMRLPGSDDVKFMERKMDSPRMPDRMDDKHSAIWLHQTMREFIGSIEETMAEMPEIQQKLDALRQEKEDMTKRLHDLQQHIAVLYKSFSDLPQDERRKQFQEAAAPFLEEQNRMLDARHNQPSIHSALVPLYLALRKKGYSHYDLIG